MEVLHRTVRRTRSHRISTPATEHTLMRLDKRRSHTDGRRRLRCPRLLLILLQAPLVRMISLVALSLITQLFLARLIVFDSRQAPLIVGTLLQVQCSVLWEAVRAPLLPVQSDRTILDSLALVILLAVKSVNLRSRTAPFRQVL